jgi:uncharacterized membrane protein
VSRRVVSWTVVVLAGAIVLAVAGAIVVSFVNGDELVADAGSRFAAYATIFGLVLADAIVPNLALLQPSARGVGSIL